MDLVDLDDLGNPLFVRRLVGVLLQEGDQLVEVAEDPVALGVVLEGEGLGAAEEILRG
ncbi:hypothetical protein ABZ614_37630 [Streptomyces sp. NPDC013178]|uniref:hypothetical protein n=1 Tax=Streptomyces sp. NPDC013178 TaxID=3155118 RepID=UPI0033FEE309